jgi:hypothetical protein
MEVGEVQTTLNQKISSNLSRIIDFTSKFIFLIKSKFKVHIFNNYYESRCKINSYKKL